MLRYLGLDEARYWNEGGFEGWDDLLGYLCTGRFGILGRRGMRETKEKDKDRTKEEMSMGADEATLKDSGEEVPEEEEDDDEGGEKVPVPPSSADPSLKEINPNDLKANDRQRASKRPLFAYYLYTYLPALLNTTSLTTTTTTSSADINPTPSPSPSRSPASTLTKDEVILSLKSHFPSSFTTNYDLQREKGMRVIGEQKLWSSIRELIKSQGGEGASLGYGMKGVKGMICSEDYSWVEQAGEAMARKDGVCGGEGGSLVKGKGRGRDWRRRTKTEMRRERSVRMG